MRPECGSEAEENRKHNATDRWHNRCLDSQVDRQAARFHEGGPRSV